MRRWVLLGCAALACSFESSSSGSSGGSASASEGSTGEVTSGTTSDGPSTGTATSGTAGSSDGTTEDPTTDPTEDPTIDPTDPASSSSTTSGGETTTSGGSHSPLSDVGLVARYFLDEAPAGSGPMFALDAAEEPFDLPLEYAQAMHYVTDGPDRGLAFDQIGADDAARAPVAGSKFDGLEGATALTFEVVLRLQDALGSASRVIHVGSGDNSVVTLAARPDEIQVRWNTTVVRHWDYTAYMDTTHVVHLVIDTSAVNEDSQFRLLVDGGELDPIIDATVPQNESASVPDDAIIALGNRNRDRTFRGVLFYAAIYGIAISDDTIADHVSALFASDDTPN